MQGNYQRRPIITKEDTEAMAFSKLGSRITSYNVCYTKLLRFKYFTSSIKKLIIIELFVIVITSYSIHYTKLYE